MHLSLLRTMNRREYNEETRQNRSVVASSAVANCASRADDRQVHFGVRLAVRGHAPAAINRCQRTLWAGGRSPPLRGSPHLGIAWVEIKLRHAEPPFDALALDNYVDRDLQELTNIIPVEVPAPL